MHEGRTNHPDNMSSTRSDGRTQSAGNKSGTSAPERPGFGTISTASGRSGRPGNASMTYMPSRGFVGNQSVPTGSVPSKVKDKFMEQGYKP